jgi:hypothetical protein
VFQFEEVTTLSFTLDGDCVAFARLFETSDCKTFVR